ncbi:STN and carboxypeptidase regulatory-like domain-containing protein [Pedobacter sp. UBA4863]|uniref:STN and carboxypeptidase regulatory-like domain-containing protein n=1 Tax=Pedobacter sp. UBA4863 TaxID=1947060 RepID=UPI0025FB596D|nr:STN and carboxypeptidase regulatory-like domain-containing protein [Pedobacter sp. UBA4863]
MKTKLLIVLFFVSFCCAAQTVINYNQSNLAKRVTLDLKSHKISSVLQKIGKAGGFYFTYNGALFAQDSIVSLNVRNKPVREVLEQLFDGKVDYKENNEYIILRYAVNHFAIEAESIVTAENLYAITGRVVDAQTGKKVKNASVYEKRLLQATLTDDEGFFSLKFKGAHSAIILTASKETYRDTSIVFLSSIDVKPKGYDDPDKEKGTFMSNLLDNFRIGRWLTSSKQRVQNMNIPNFLANMPVQASIIPGLSSHGSMSGSVVNKFSLNLMGGYTAGVDGAEIAGMFNLNKADVRYLQMAGILNVTGGSTTGAQIAGVVNMVAQNANGVQVAGVYNHVRGNVNGVQVATANYVKGLTEGVQISAVGNLVADDFHGTQLTGFTNVVRKETQGFQLSAFGNMALQEMKGMQLSGIFNYAKHNKGFQLGLVNIADTSSGVSLGLINVVRHGYHKLSLSSNDLINANVAFKSGNANLYTIFLVGKNFVKDENITTFGFGFGHDFFAGSRLSFSTELTAQQLHLGRWDYANILNKFQLNFQIRIVKGWSVFAGPVLNYYVTEAPANYISAKGYKTQIEPANSKNINGYKGWIGWTAGVNIF